jgi:hypothetical protein
VRAGGSSNSDTFAAMATADDVQRKLQAVLDEAKAVTATVQHHDYGTFADEAMAQRWATKVESLLTSVFGGKRRGSLTK